ncbi:MAG: zinc finger domain-containing protein [Dehalococcoidia bacterium]
MGGAWRPDAGAGGTGGVRLPQRHAALHRGEHEASGGAPPAGRRGRACRAGPRWPGTALGRVAGLHRCLRRENHTLKRALTDPRLFSGIGNAYADEILHRARLSPVQLTARLDDEQIDALRRATRDVLIEWTDRLRVEVGEGFPEKVTAFREGMAVHGRYRQPCPVCATPVQRIVYAENETNYCARCQTDGRLLADRALSALLEQDWPVPSTTCCRRPARPRRAVVGAAVAPDRPPLWTVAATPAASATPPSLPPGMCTMPPGRRAAVTARRLAPPSRFPRPLLGRWPRGGRRGTRNRERARAEPSRRGRCDGAGRVAR